MYTEIREKLMKDEEIQNLLNEDVVLKKAIIAPEILKKLNKLMFATLVDNGIPKNEKLDLIKRLYKAGAYQQKPNPVLDFIKILHINEQQLEAFEKICESSTSEPETILDKFFSDPSAFSELNFEVSSDNVSRYIRFVEYYAFLYSEGQGKNYFEALNLVLNNLNPIGNIAIQEALVRRLRATDVGTFRSAGPSSYYREMFALMLKNLNEKNVLNLIDYFNEERIKEEGSRDRNEAVFLIKSILESILLDNDRDLLEKARIIKSFPIKAGKDKIFLYEALDEYFDKLRDEPKLGEIMSQTILSMFDSDDLVAFVSRKEKSDFYSKFFIENELLSKFSFKVDDANYDYYKDLIQFYGSPHLYTDSRLKMFDIILSNLEGIEHPEIQKALLSEFNWNVTALSYHYKEEDKPIAMKMMKSILAHVPRHSMISSLQTNFLGEGIADFCMLAKHLPELTNFILQQLTKEEREEFLVNILSSFRDNDYYGYGKSDFLNTSLLDYRDSLEKILLTPNKDGVFIFYDYQILDHVFLNEVLKLLNKPTIQYTGDAKQALEQLFVIYPELKQIMEVEENRNKIIVFAREELSKRIDEQARDKVIDRNSLEKILLTPNKDGVFIFYDYQTLDHVFLNEVLKLLNKPTIQYTGDAKETLEQLFVIYPDLKQTMEAAENRNKVTVFARNIVDARKELSKRIEEQAKKELIDSETAMDQETSSMVNEQFEKIKKKYQTKFELFGATHDERIEAVESKIKEAILSTIIDELMLDRDSMTKKLKQLEDTKRTSEASQHSILDLKIKELNEKIKRKEEVLDFIGSNLKLLTELPDPAKDNVLIVSEGKTRKELREAARNKATKYLTENTHAQAAWRCYDPLAPYNDAVWKNLLLPPPYGRDPTLGIFTGFGAREALSDESGSKIVRERAAYYYLLADRAENRSERMGMFITALGEVRRGHIAKFSSNEKDEVPCFPGFLSNLAKGTLNDPEFPLPMSFHELVKEKMREIFADKFEKALRKLKTKSEQDALYQAVTSLSYHNADDVLKSNEDALYPSELVKVRENFLAKLPSYDQVLKEVNESVVALTGFTLPKADEVYVRAYYQDPGFDPNRLTIYYQACQEQLEALKLETVDEQPISSSTVVASERATLTSAGTENMLESFEHPFPLPEQADLPPADEKREAFRAKKINKHRSQAEKHYCYNAFLPIIQGELKEEPQEFIAEIVKEIVATLVATNAREPQARIDEVLHDISNRSADDKLITQISNEKVISILKKPDTLDGLMKAIGQASKYHMEQVEALKKSISPEPKPEPQPEKEKPAPEFLSLMGVRKQTSQEVRKVKEKEEKSQNEKAKQDRPRS